MLGPTGHVSSPTAAHRYVPENCEDIAALPSGQWRRGVRRVITDCWGYTMKFRLHHHSMPMSPAARRAPTRARWAAIGAAVAVSVGAGGVWHAHADDVEGSVLTAITPQRLLDTRSASPVGALDGTGAPLRLQISGDAVPAGASAVVMNVTAVQARTSSVGGFVTVYPCDVPRPNTSNLNFVDGQTVPNQVTVGLAADGTVCFYVYGRAHLLADVTGYVDDARLRSIEAELSALGSADRDPVGAADLSDYYTAADTDAAIAAAVATVPTVDVSALVTNDELAESMAALGDAMATTVTSAVDDAVADAVADAVTTDITPTMTELVDTAVPDAVDGAVDDAVNDAVPAAVAAALADVDTTRMGVPVYGRTVATVGEASQPAFWTHSGFDVAIVEGVDGRVLMAHRDDLGSVWATACADVLCSTATSQLVLASGGEHGLDVVLGPDGYPRVATDDAAASPSLVVVTCGDLTCATTTSATVPTAGDAGREAALTIDATGAVLVAHRGSAGLFLTRCADTTCATASTITIAGDHHTPDITVGADGHPVIVTAGSAGITMLRCADIVCSAIDSAHVLAAGGASPQSAIGVDARPVVAHVDDGSLVLQVCGDAACAAVTSTHTIDSHPAGVGGDLSLTIAADGHPTLTHLIAAGTEDTLVRITDCADTACAEATSTSTEVAALAAASVTARDAALLTAVRVGDASSSGVHLHRRIHSSITANGW